MDPNLKKRVLTASVLLPTILVTVLFLPPVGFEYLSGLILAMAGWEWTRLSGFIFFRSRLAAFFIGLGMTFFLRYYCSPSAVLCSSLGLWGVLFLSVLFFPSTKRFFTYGWVVLFIGICFLLTAWLAVNYLRQLPGGLQWVLMACSIVWIADTAAYFAGRAFGRHLLAPAVSPKKTWEGAIGATLGVIIGTIIAWYTIDILQTYSLLHVMMIATATTWAAILGDLVESLFKRLRGMKDSGSMLPGHGGILDRIDGLIAALPLFVYFIQ